MSRRGDCPPRLESNSPGAACASPMNGERSYEDFILAALVQFASQQQADPPGFAPQSAATAALSGGAGGSRHADANAADGP